MLAQGKTWGDEPSLQRQTFCSERQWSQTRSIVHDWCKTKLLLFWGLPVLGKAQRALQ